ncbi:MAG: Transcriptional regulator NrdR [Candidatus Magasanikbacteria bacterium GW2011_GWA2_45_39]|uniref:Transcriptional repressor NrdR n=2 Tax=Candidatus Magasanikiibacteriota TaxID=1752731 RepID=A0A0G1N0S6_9BACT|nr:MAG: Transcriptional regulator NrdR [Candidatus Magasanikbacteria bacterium GW2011_GWA2_45_39]KKU14221.1 MAG: Transcriptional regulator NrdR [Candidatus Magasanikbacteria bacterium GW2011_GWC2_45_8]HBW73748.1 transcriptional regulator NrdR [Candidatus Magasanikbacteria bacterium]
MRCPVCNFYDTKVVDSRLLPEGLSIRRRRECEKCQFRFSTLEEIELLDLTVVKRDGTREAYNRGKIEEGLHNALEKRPYTAENFQLLIHAIERDIQKRKKREITTQDIGEIVMNRLKGFDKIAYIRFASVYRAFEDVETFQKELGKLLGRAAAQPSPKRRRGRLKKKIKK